MKNQNTSNFNVWNYKPWWCQPWSIILTGITIIGISWLLFHIVWLSVIVAMPIILWWIYFLVLYPRMVQKMYDSGINS
ncbi:conserved hypothetical protein [Hyella patelloides LEGE 07179]|uniref:DUF6737 domain-containing protein n=1 Tax=Hyella patelloides LEGE 07179 TaxID=945734 RepID=A0A563VZT5_9CYAN|nr:DUF6737 family protein [Hyella patelloides]VEP16930.1 conserved hypothetical protein [Hyella patelloides LEGE 07179]